MSGELCLYRVEVHDFNTIIVNFIVVVCMNDYFDAIQ